MLGLQRHHNFLTSKLNDAAQITGVTFLNVDKVLLGKQLNQVKLLKITSLKAKPENNRYSDCYKRFKRNVTSIKGCRSISRFNT